MSKAVESIVAERNAQKQDPKLVEFDKTNTVNDYIAYVTAYLGRAADKVLRNEKEGHDQRKMLVKAGALVVAAINKIDGE